MRTYTILVSLLGALLLGIGMSRDAPNAWAGSVVGAGCFDCQNGGSCDPGYHSDDNTGPQQYQGPNPAHSGCSDYACDLEHYPYSLEQHDDASISLGGPGASRSRDLEEVRVLVGRVLRAAHDADVAELADLTRDDVRVRINVTRRAVQVVLAGDVVAHATLPIKIVDGVLAHH